MTLNMPFPITARCHMHRPRHRGVARLGQDQQHHRLARQHRRTHRVHGVPLDGIDPGALQGTLVGVLLGAAIMQLGDRRASVWTRRTNADSDTGVVRGGGSTVEGSMVNQRPTRSECWVVFWALNCPTNVTTFLHECQHTNLHLVPYLSHHHIGPLSQSFHPHHPRNPFQRCGTWYGAPLYLQSIIVMVVVMPPATRQLVLTLLAILRTSLVAALVFDSSRGGTYPASKALYLQGQQGNNPSNYINNKCLPHHNLCCRCVEGVCRLSSCIHIIMHMYVW